MPATRKPGTGRKPAAKRSGGAARPSAKAKTTKKQPVRGKANTGANSRKAAAAKAQPQNQAQKNDTAALAYFCIGILLAIAVISYWMGSDSAFLVKFNRVLEGLFGSLTILLPACLMWMGVRRYKRAGEDQESSRGTGELLPVCALISILTVVQAFSAGSIKAGMKVDSFLTFVRYSYDALTGGGAVGAVIGYWGAKLSPVLTLVIAIMIMALLLSKSGLFSVRSLGKAVGNGTKSVTKKVAAISKVAIDDGRRLFIDNKNAGSRGEAEIPDLTRESRMTRTQLQSVGDVGDELHIDEARAHVKPAFKPVAEKPASRRKTDVYSERVGTPEETPKKPASRAAEPVKPVRKPEPARKPEPVRKAPVYEPPADDFPDYDEALPEEPVAQEDDYDIPDEYIPVHREPVKREPQQPKPSFFDGDSDKGHEVRQKSDQGRKLSEERADVKPGRSISEMDRYNPAVKREYQFPSFDLMETSGAKAAEDNSILDKKRGEALVEILGHFNIPVKLVGISHGPAVTRLEILPDPGIKVSRIAQYSEDIQMGLEVRSVRIEAPIPGRKAVGVEIPNPKREIVNLRDVLECPKARSGKEKLQVALGKDNGGNYILADLAGMPHVLIAGQTGSGKSICINAIIISLLYRYTPDEVRLIMVDPKMVELNVYNTIPHLLVPVVTDPQKAAGALDWAVMEMTKRYQMFKEHGTKNIESYNQHLAPDEKPMPRIVIIVDELADLMMTAKHDVEESINRLAQLARAAGMHLVIATQRPSVNVITGLIKANIPTRIAFTVASGVDSNTILDCYGAERLLGKGDMLYAAADANKPMRMQGAWVSEDEVQAVVEHISSQESAVFDEEIMDHLENATMPDAEKKDKQDKEACEETDPLLLEALRAVVEANQASISMLQRKLKVGYPRAGKLIDMMEQRGFVSKGEGSKAREVIITREQMERLFSGDSEDDPDAI